MKAILLTFSVTVAIVALVAALFFQSILGMFRLAVVPIETLESLRASQNVVERMKQRHAQKKLKVSSKFVKRPVRRIAAASVAAATPVYAVAAVAVTMAALEVADYCEEQQELHEDANVLYASETKFDLAKCIEEGKKDSHRLVSEVRDSSIGAVSIALNNTAQYSAKKFGAIKEKILETLDVRRKEADELWDAGRSSIVK